MQQQQQQQKQQQPGKKRHLPRLTRLQTCLLLLTLLVVSSLLVVPSVQPVKAPTRAKGNATEPLTCGVAHPSLLALTRSRTPALLSFDPPLPLSAALSSACDAVLLDWQQRRQRRQLEASGADRHKAKVCFERRLARLPQAELFASLAAVRDIFEANNVTHYIEGGTLIGSLRHLGVVPWDDDMDIDILHDHKPKAWKLLQQLEAGSKGRLKLVDMERTDMIWKLFFMCNGGRRATCKTFIDFFFMRIGPDKLLHCKRFDYPKNKVPVSFVFPLRRRPVGQLLFWSPNKPIDFLNRWYGGGYRDSCVDAARHMGQPATPICRGAVKVGCDLLRHRYPMALRVVVGGLCGSAGQLELLELNGKVHSAFYDPQSSVICKE